MWSQRSSVTSAPKIPTAWRIIDVDHAGGTAENAAQRTNRVAIAGGSRRSGSSSVDRAPDCIARVIALPADNRSARTVYSNLYPRSAARIERIDQVQRLQTIDHRDRCGMIDLDNGRRRNPDQDFSPAICRQSVSRNLSARMQSRNRSLNDIGTGTALNRQCLLDKLQSLGDLALVPKRAVLMLKQNDVAFRRLAAGASRVMKEHQREQASDLGTLRHQGIEQPAQPDGFPCKVRTHEIVAGGRGITFVEDQIDRGEDVRNRSSSASRGGTPYGIAARRIFCFARVRRCAIAFDERNARATAAVLNPHTVFSVNAI